MLTLQIQFDRRVNSQTALASIRVRKNKSGVCLQGDLLHIPAGHDQNIRMGRSWICEVFLLDADATAGGVAKEHLQIEVISQLCFVRDLATKNGTQLNGQWLGGAPDPHGLPATRTPSGRKPLKKGDVIRLPGMTLTVVEVPAIRPLSERPSTQRPHSSGHSGSAASEAGSASGAALRLPPIAVFQPAGSLIAPPIPEGFKFAATLGGKPASGLTYLYERETGSEPGCERWVVKYFSLPPSADLAALRQLLADFCGVQHVALRHPHAYALVPTSHPAHLALCFPQLQGVNLVCSPLLDLAGIHDVMTVTLGALAALHEQGLAHGHVCAGNIFLETSGQIAVTDSGMDGIRSLIGAELTRPMPSAHHDLIALGDLCLKLLGESAFAPQRPLGKQPREHPPVWPGAPLQALACRLRLDPQLTSSQALDLMQEVPRPQVNRLVTVPQWKGRL